MLFPLLVWGR